MSRNTSHTHFSDASIDKQTLSNLAARPNGKRSGSRPGRSDNGMSNDRKLLSRRGFLYGAIGVGAVAAGGIGYSAYKRNQESRTDFTYLEAPESALTTLNDMDVVDDYMDRVVLQLTADLPYGSLVWANSDAVAACLLPTDQGSPLTQIALLWLRSGTVETVVANAIEQQAGFEIYDARGTENGIIWTEANILDGKWRIYIAPYKNDALGEAVLVESGDSTYEMPSLAAVGQYAFWQIMPRYPNEEGLPYTLKRASFAKADIQDILVNPRRFGTSIYACESAVVVTPRKDVNNVYYQLTHINARTAAITDTLVLPHAMRPLEAGYGKNGFIFSFENIYTYGGAIANLGTYTPLVDASEAHRDYSAAPWFGFARTPTAPPCWAGDLFIVKSSYSVCGVDMKRGEYFAIDVDSGADDYGEYLATTGMHETFVTYTNVDYTPVNDAPIKRCRVKVWKPIALESE